MARRMLKAGTLRHPITIQSNTIGRDAYGGLTESWATHFTTRASVNSIGATERQSGDRITADHVYEFIFRVNPSKSVTPQNRISYDSRTFDIETVENFEEKDHIIRLTAVERNL